MKLYPIQNTLFAGLDFSVSVKRVSDVFTIQALTPKATSMVLAEGAKEPAPPPALATIDGVSFWAMGDALSFKFADLVSHPAHDDHSMWLIVQSFKDGAAPTLALMPYYYESQATKEHPAVYSKRVGTNVIGGILVPFKGAAADQCVMWINQPSSAAKLQVEGLEVTANTFKTGDDVRAAVLPNIHIAGPAAPVTAPFDLTFTLTDDKGAPVGYDCALFFEAINCQITENRIKTVKGVAKTTVSAISGASDVRVKVGFKYFSGKAEWQLTR
jgi:hypothetical protein